MFSKHQKKQKKAVNNLGKVSNLEGSEDFQSSDSDNIRIDNEPNNNDQSSGYEQSIIEEEEEPSLSENSTSIIPNNYSNNFSGNYNNNFPQLQSADFIDSSEFSILKTEIQNRFDVQPNVKLPVAVEYSLGAISDRADFGCKSIHNNVEELSALTEEIIQKSKECNHLISRLNQYTIKVSKELRMTQQSIQQIKVPRRSLLQLLMLFFAWLIDLFIEIYHKVQSRNRAINNS